MRRISCRRKIRLFHGRRLSSEITSDAGQASLPVILLISGILVVIAVVGSIIAVALNNTILGARLGGKALAAAETGANDAITQIQRGCVLSNTCPSSYTVNIDYQTTAQITIVNNNGIVTVNSIGNSGGRQSEIRAVLGVDTATGLVNIRSFGQVPL